MIRINLLGVERQKARKAIAFDIGQSVTVACSLILVATVLLVGWWFWSLREESSRVDAELAAGQQEAARLQSLLGEVQQFEQQRARLQERVALIEQLRSGQSIPVQLLDHVSRSLPDMLWLTSMQQEASQVTIEGRCTTLIALSDFVGNLAGSELLRKPIEIVNSQVQPATGTGTQATPELIQFTVRAQMNTPPQAAAEPPGRGARGAQGGAARGRQGAPR
jgi:type IV pilus assembly protein PilN